jgi:hypothetical protein
MKINHMNREAMRFSGIRMASLNREKSRQDIELGFHYKGSCKRINRL